MATTEPVVPPRESNLQKLKREMEQAWAEHGCPLPVDDESIPPELPPERKPEEPA